MKIEQLLEGKVFQLEIPPSVSTYGGGGNSQPILMSIVENPTHDQIMRMMEKSRTHVLRGFIHSMSPRMPVFVWDGSQGETMHFVIKKNLGIQNYDVTNCDFMLTDSQANNAELDTGSSNWFTSDMHDLKVLVGSKAPQFITSRNFNAIFGGLPPRDLERWVQGS